MTENISFKKCTCDICGRVQSCKQSQILPADWEKITVIYSYDVCKDCLEKVSDYIKRLKQEENK